MADLPSRALVVYGDGFAPLINPSYSHLHTLAALSSCGLLAVRSSPLASECCNREIEDFAQVVDAYESYIQDKHGDDTIHVPEKSSLTISGRFMGLKALLVSSGPSVGSFARDLGFTVLEIEELLKQNCCHPNKCDSEPFMTTHLLTRLGFSEGKVLDHFDYDLVFFHLKAGQTVEVLKDKMAIKTDASWLNKLVGEILKVVQPGSDIASRLHFSLILTDGRVDEKDCRNSYTLTASTKINSDLYLLRPRQSYTMKGGEILEDIRHDHPFLISQWQEAVTRKDFAKEFSYKEFEEKGGNLTILADRFLHEVAFKLWKAPKYGA